ncbi:MAG: hypothetical protein HY321_01090 [Armatimonadetes bacterium]|nr:hypothetical protein [Armatimonadota bacterium]
MDRHELQRISAGLGLVFACLQRSVRPQASYQRSLSLLRRAREMAPEGLTKSGLMLGLGEAMEEVLAAMADIRAAGCDILTLGQYLRPSLKHLPIARYYTPEEFRDLRRAGLRLGFRHVESAPLVRSSYHADEQARSSGALTEKESVGEY